MSSVAEVLVLLSGDDTGAIRSLTETGLGLSKLDAAAKESSNNFLKVAAAGVLSVVGLGVAAVDFAAKYQTATAKMAALSGITMANAKAIGDAFLTTGGKSTFSAQQMMEAYAPVSGQLEQVVGHALSTKQAMDFMAAATTLADASGQELNSTTATLSKTLQMFSLPMTDAAKVTDILFGTASATGMSVDSLAQMLNRAKSSAGAVAPSLSDLATLMVDVKNHGEDGKVAVSLLASATKGLIQPTDQVRAAQKKYGDSFVDAKGNMVSFREIIRQVAPDIKGMGDAQAIATLKTLGFGGASAKLLDTIKAGPEAWDKASQAVNKNGAAAEAAEKNNATLGKVMEQIKAVVADFAVIIGQFLLPPVQWLAETILPVLTEALNDVGAGFGAVWDLISPVVDVVAGGLSDAFNDFKDGPLKALADKLEDFGKSALGKSVTWIGKFVTAVKHDLTDALNNFKNSPLASLARQLGDLGSGALGTVVKAVGGLVKAVRDDLGGVFDRFKDGPLHDLKQKFDDFGSAGFFAWLASVITTVRDDVGGAFDRFTAPDGPLDKVKQAFDKFQNSAVVHWLRDVGDKIKNDLSNAFNVFHDKVLTPAKKKWDEFQGDKTHGLWGVWNAIWALVNVIYHDLGVAIVWIKDNILPTFKTAWDHVTEAVEKLFDAMGDPKHVIEKWETVTQLLGEHLDQVASAVGAIAEIFTLWEIRKQALDIWEAAKASEAAAIGFGQWAWSMVPGGLFALGLFGILYEVNQHLKLVTDNLWISVPAITAVTVALALLTTGIGGVGGIGKVATKVGEKLAEVTGFTGGGGGGGLGSIGPAVKGGISKAKGAIFGTAGTEAKDAVIASVSRDAEGNLVKTAAADAVEGTAGTPGLLGKAKSGIGALAGGLGAGASAVKGKLLGTAAEDGAEASKGWLKAAADTASGWAKSAATTLGHFATMAGGAAKNAGKATLEWLGSSAKTLGGWAVAAAKSVASFAAMAAGATVNAVKVGAVWLAEKVTFLAGQAVKLVAWLAANAVMLATAIVTGIGAAIAFMLPLLPFILIGAAIALLVYLVVTHFSEIRDFIGKVVEHVVSFFKEHFGQIGGFIGTVVGNVIAFFKSIPEKVGGVINDIVQFFRDLPGKIVGAVGSGLKVLESFGGDIIQGIKNGIENAWHFVTDKMRDLVKAIPGPIAHLMGISSPSRVMADLIGKPLAQGIGMGIDQGADTVHTAMGRITANLKSMSPIGIGVAGSGAGAGASGNTHVTVNNPSRNVDVVQALMEQQYLEKASRHYTPAPEWPAGYGNNR